MSTLGQRLAQNQADHADKSTAAARARAERESAEGARKFKLVEDFFALAKGEIEKSILAGEHKVEIFLGSNGRKVEHQEVERLLNRAHYDQELSKRLSSDRHPYFPLWRDFSAWAASEGLHVEFKYQYDGGGVHSWHVLTAQPLAQSGLGFPKAR